NPWPTSRPGSRPQLGDDLRANAFEGRQARHPADAGDDVLRARVAELPEPVDHLVGRSALQVDALQGAALDLVVGPAQPLTVLAEHVVLVPDPVRAAKDVGRVRVLRNQAERLLLAAAPDH